MAETSESPSAASPPREFLALEVEGLDASVLATALEVSPWMASQIVRRGGHHLIGARPVQDGAALAEGLASFGIRAFRVPEAEVRTAPTRIVRGGWSDGRLVLKCEEGSTRELHLGDVLLVVHGVITRSFQSNAVRRKIQSVRLDEGHRFHLHLRSLAAPLELDPADLELSPVGTMPSAFLEIRAWLEAGPAALRIDEGFRHLTPALSPHQETKDVVGGLLGARAEGARERAVILDNLIQFRVYSGWRGGLERRR